MSTQKQVLLIGIIFIISFSGLFLNNRQEYTKNINTISLEIDGIEKITNIHNLDILLKNMRGISQLSEKEAVSVKNTLMITDRSILVSIKKINDKSIENFYLDFRRNQKTMSKIEIFNTYTKLLKLLNRKKLDIADKSHLFFDSNRERYFLITTTLLEIPEIIENIAKIRGIGTNILSSTKDSHTKQIFLLKNNLYSFRNKIEDIKYTTSKLNINDKTIINSLLIPILNDYEKLEKLVSDIENKAKIAPKEYFLKTSDFVNRIDKLYTTSKNILLDKLKNSKTEFENKLLFGTIIYIFLIFLTTLVVYILFKNRDKEIKKEQDEFISLIQNNYAQEQDLKSICNKSINHIINYFQAINGSLYLYNEDNKKLYLSATYGIKYDSISQTLDLHQNIISENILEKKIKIIDIQQQINIGTVDTIGTKLVIIPMIEFDKSIGTMQLVFDNKFKLVDIEFLNKVITIMSAYINKAQKDEESLKYLKLIDKNVLISKTDLDGNMIEVSDYFCKLSKYSKEELIGRNHRILRHEDMTKDFFKNLWDTILDGKIWRGDVKNKTKDGGFFWADTTISPDRDINGNIIGYTVIRNDITDKKLIEEISITDGLTSLYNRRHFDNVFEQQIKQSKRDKNLLGFLIIDIDHFKQYNDTYGHQEGDKTLQRVAKVLKETLKRPNDYTFRLGGEEFGLLYQTKDKDGAIAIADKARASVENLKIEHSKNSASKYITISSGLYIVNNDDKNNISQIYKKADEALYKAKESGRNRVVLGN